MICISCNINDCIVNYKLDTNLLLTVWHSDNKFKEHNINVLCFEGNVIFDIKFYPISVIDVTNQKISEKKFEILQLVTDYVGWFICYQNHQQPTKNITIMALACPSNWYLISKYYKIKRVRQFYVLIEMTLKWFINDIQIIREYFWISKVKNFLILYTSFVVDFVIFGYVFSFVFNFFWISDTILNKLEQYKFPSCLLYYYRSIMF